MSEEETVAPRHIPPHALFLKWGKLELGAFGIPAIGALVIIALIAAGWIGLF